MTSVKYGVGFSSSITSVSLPTARTANRSIGMAPVATARACLIGNSRDANGKAVFGSSIRWKDQTQSVAVNGRPSDQRVLGRNLKV